MTKSLFDRVLIPVASEEDAKATCEAILPYLQRADGSCIPVHVVKHKEGGISAAPLDAREEDAEQIIRQVREKLGDKVVETDIIYGPKIAEAILEAADETNASAIAFSTREESHLIKLLTGDIALSLIAEADLPVVVVPAERE